MSTGNVVVSQDAPAKNNLWIQPKGTARFWNGSIWKTITGGGGSGDYLTREAADELYQSLSGMESYLTKTEATNTYLSIAFFERLFKAYNGSSIVHPNDTTSTIDNIKAMFGFWTEQYISALGQNSSGGGGGMDETALWQELTDNSQWTQGDNKIININHLPNNINADTVDGYHANSFAFANGTNATGTWGISISGNAATATTATTATYDSGGNTISSTYLPLTGGTMTGTINSQSILPKTTNTYDIGNESYNYSYGCFNVLYPGTNNNTWIRSNAAYGSSYGIVFGYGGKTASTTLGKWTYTGLGIGTDSPSYKLDVSGKERISVNNEETALLLFTTYSNTSSKRASIEWHDYSTGSNSITGCIDTRYNGTTVDMYFGSLYNNGYNTTTRMVIKGNGNVGIGTASPAYKLDVSGVIRATDVIFGYAYSKSNNMAAFVFDKPGSNYTGIGAVGVSDTIHFGPCTIAGAWVSNYNQNWEFQGNVYALGGVTALASVSSDKRLKKEIKPFNAKQIIDKLKPVEFEWNNKAKKYNSNFKDGKNYGLIAQDSDGIIDNLVFDLPDGKGYKGVRYEKLIPILLQAIKEQNEKIEDLEYEINVLKGFYK